MMSLFVPPTAAGAWSFIPQNATGLLATMRAAMPDDPISFFQPTMDKLALAPKEDGKKILVVGDSWGTVTAAGSAANLSFFQRVLDKHGCNATSASIAVPGTTSDDWDSGVYHEAMKLAAKLVDQVWIVLMGNDALDQMPTCAAAKKSADACADELYSGMLISMPKIVDAIHMANPAAKVVGFGYDTMFGGLGCGVVTRDMFPQCYKLGGGGNSCFNRQFLRIQAVWDELAKTRPWLTNASILGATQVADGDTKASTGADRHIDMDKMGPAKYWPDYEGCFHPGVLGGDDSGAMVVMEEFHRVYWASQLGC
jgi:hypothetical protein